MCSAGFTAAAVQVASDGWPNTSSGSNSIAGIKCDADTITSSAPARDVTTTVAASRAFQMTKQASPAQTATTTQTTVSSPIALTPPIRTNP